MMIDGNKVVIKHDGVQVGCVFVPIEDIRTILKKVDEREDLELDLTDVSSADTIKHCKETFSHNLFNRRSGGNYAGKGLFLDSGWVIVTDDTLNSVLVRRNDVIHTDHIARGD